MLKLGLIGYPLQQSLSPRLHAAAFAAMGLEGEYRLFPVPPLPEGANELQRFACLVRRGEIDGLNITLPHKQAIISFLDELTPTAQAIGAVNTIFRLEGKAVGDNTDAPGFLTDLEGKLDNPDGDQLKKPAEASPPAALVMGAGGAARAVVYALWESGWQVYLTARRPEQAQALITGFSMLTEASSLHRIVSLCLDPASLQQFVSSPKRQSLKVIVNTTPVGMIPDVDSCPWPDGVSLPAGVFIYDLINKPPETKLVRRARETGLATSNGHGMLIEQAALSLERWSGLPVPRQAMRQAVVDFLAENNSSAPTLSAKENQ